MGIVDEPSVPSRDSDQDGRMGSVRRRAAVCEEVLEEAAVMGRRVRVGPPEHRSVLNERCTAPRENCDDPVDVGARPAGHARRLAGNDSRAVVAVVGMRETRS